MSRRAGRCGPARLQLAAVLVLLLVPASAALGAEGGSGIDPRSGVIDAAPGGGLETVLFYMVAGMTIVSSIGVCVCKSVVRMAVFLFSALGAVSLLYFLLAANFLGAIQLIVYAGGTLVLLIFGVMLTSKSPWVRFDAPKIEVFGAAVVCGTLLAALTMLVVGATWSNEVAAMPGTAVIDIGRGLMTYYLVPFEAAGVLLMIVMVGAAHLA
ncbi:MAG: NADH-quinone oxidoreductase subunit J, partial [Phycisphaerae bacterium]